MDVRHIGLLIVLLVQGAWQSPAVLRDEEEWIAEDDPRVSCLQKFGFPEGTEQRIFKVAKCSSTHTILVDCSEEMMIRIANVSATYLKRKFSEMPEDFSHFLAAISQTWWIVFREIHIRAKCGFINDGALCWDFYPMLRTVMELDLLNSYFIWISPYVVPIIIVEVTFGIIANALVIIVITKFKEMRTEPNMIILNIAISDIFMLINFTVLSSLIYLIPVTMVLRGFCRKLLYFSTFNSTCSVYSMVALSFLRYMAISAVPGSRALHIIKYVKIPMVIALVWLVSSLASIPYILDISENCIPNFDPLLHTLGLLSFCVLPITLLIKFNNASRRKLKKSIEEMPGNRHQRMEYEIWARERAAGIILALSVVFVITLVLPTIATFISIFTEVRSENYFRAVVRQMLFFLNTCINPVAVFASSKAFRKHLGLVLPSGIVGHKFASSSGDTCVTSS